MATSAEGRRLTEDQRQAQLAIRAAFLRRLVEAWPLLDPRRLDETAPGWLRLMVSDLARSRAESAQSGLSYYQRFRAAETGSDSPVLMPDLPFAPLDAAARTSLIVTGPVEIKAKTADGTDLDVAARQALRGVSDAAGRHVLAGGRATVVAAAEADRQAVAWARVTDGDPCHFCALLASRGFVYRSEGTATFQADGVDRYHDGCGCVAEPSFDRDAEPPGRSAEFLDIYTEAAAGHSGKPALRAFRRAYEAQQRASHRRL